MPWALDRGDDIKGNLRKLLEGTATWIQGAPEGSEVARSWMECEQCGVGGSLLPDVEWSTIAVEQGHGSCAVLHRFHPDMEQHILANRSMLRQPIRLRRPHLLLGVTAATPGKDSCCNSSDL